MNLTTDTIAARLQRCLPRLPLELQADARIADLGLDSMDTVELLCAVHEEFGVRLTESDFHAGQSIHGLFTAIASKTQPLST